MEVIDAMSAVWSAHKDWSASGGLIWLVITSVAVATVVGIGISFDERLKQVS